MTTLEFIATIDGAFCPDDFKRGLRAVLEKNVGPMVEKAHLDGADETLALFIAKMGARETNVAPGTIARMASDYRARILAQLTKQNERTG